MAKMFVSKNEALGSQARSPKYFSKVVNLVLVLSYFLRSLILAHIRGYLNDNIRQIRWVTNRFRFYSSLQCTSYTKNSGSKLNLPRRH